VRLRNTLLLLGTFIALQTACGRATAPNTTSGISAHAEDARMSIVAAENVWGSIALQLGGDHVLVTSIISNPNSDPHDYEPTTNDARLIASARYVIANGAGYDPWAKKLLDANPVAGRRALDVGAFVGKKDGDNPHLWYDPDVVARVADKITADLKAFEPAGEADFDRQHEQFANGALKPYRNLLATIRQRYAGTPVGATESIFVYMAQALDLRLVTPPGFMQAISNGQEPTVQDKATFDEQVTHKRISVLIVNKQNATPDTTILQQKAQAAGIPVVEITETLVPATATFQDWQFAQLQALQQALANATSQ
jgi:zinc/manganese transport system substrate-binding protein